MPTTCPYLSVPPITGGPPGGLPPSVPSVGAMTPTLPAPVLRGYALARLGAHQLGAVLGMADQPPPAPLEIAGVRRLPDEPLTDYLLRVDAALKARQPPPPRYWWHDNDDD